MFSVSPTPPPVTCDTQSVTHTHTHTHRLGIETKTLHVLDELYTTEPHPVPKEGAVLTINRKSLFLTGLLLFLCIRVS
jgi:hypothetical protein